MSVVDIILIAAIAAVLILCIRSLRRGGGECSSCSSETCSVHGGTGGCSAAEDMLAHADARLKEKNLS